MVARDTELGFSVVASGRPLVVRKDSIKHLDRGKWRQCVARV